jgi:hypothetical protein
MDIKDETTEDTKDATLDTKDADAVVDAAKEVNAQERRHNHESIAGPTASNCAHASTECNYKDDGHIDGATYSNKQGGSTHNCNGADSWWWGTVTTKQTSFLANTVVPPKKYLANHTAIVNTGATGHYLDNAATPYCTTVEHTTTGPSVKVKNGHNIETSRRALVPLAKELSTKAKTGHIFDDLKSGSLISIGQLCDDDCIALFTKYDVQIYKDGKVIIVGQRNNVNGLWHIPLAPKETNTAQSQHSANSTIRNVKTKQDLAAFLHAQYSTFLRAIRRNHFESWPGLTTTLITKHLQKSLATSKGHLRMEQQKIQSTKITTDLDFATSLDIIPTQEPNNLRTNAVIATILTDTDLRKSYSDQTGKFPVQSSRGYNYVMILYDYDSNVI